MVDRGAMTPNISIHAPRGGSDTGFPRNIRHKNNFNPRSPWGERHHLALHGAAPIGFQSTLPVGGATGVTVALPPATVNFNPRSPWGERHGHCAYCCMSVVISIHAPRGGSDRPAVRYPTRPGYFNPRSPWGERHDSWFGWHFLLTFQSTLPVGGATRLGHAKTSTTIFQSTLPVGGATLAESF